MNPTALGLKLFSRLQLTSTMWCEALKIVRTDGTTYRFSSHDDKTLVTEADGNKYEYVPAGAFNITAIEWSSGLSITNMDIEAAITDDAIEESDIRDGRFRGATCEFYIHYWGDKNILPLLLRVAKIGEIEADDSVFKAELRGLGDQLGQVFTNTVSLECRYDFGDSKCGIDKNLFTVSHTITDVASRSQFRCNLSTDNGVYKWGLARWTSGKNVGQEMEIMRHFQNKFGVFLPMPYEVEVGDTIDMIRGCPKTYGACTFYGNIINFGAEPFVVGSDWMGTYPNG